MPRRHEDGTLIPVRCAIIWYADDSKLACFTDDEWRAAETDGVVLVQVLYDYVLKGKWLQEILHGFDYYWLRDGSYFTGNARHLPPGTPPELVKRGKQVLDRQFHVVFHNAAHEGVLAKL